MIIKETTPPVERVFTMELGGRELAEIRKGLILALEKEQAEREQQTEYAMSTAEMGGKAPMELVSISGEQAIIEHLLANIRHIERPYIPKHK